MILIVFGRDWKIRKLIGRTSALRNWKIFKVEGTSAGEIWAGADVVNARDVISQMSCNGQDGQGHAKEGLAGYDNTLPEIEHHTGNRFYTKHVVNWAPIVLSMRHYCLELGISTYRSGMTYRK